MSDRFTVSTDRGDYVVYAASRADAERQVYYLTGGRATYMVTRRG